MPVYLPPAMAVVPLRAQGIFVVSEMSSEMAIVPVLSPAFDQIV